MYDRRKWILKACPPQSIAVISFNRLSIVYSLTRDNDSYVPHNFKKIFGPDSADTSVLSMKLS